MGNNIASGSSKAAKVMKINGEFFKLNLPAKVFDVIKDYPNHVLLDSEDFLRFNLRAEPLDSEAELKPRKIYLLVDLPKFPGPIRRVRSSVNVSTVESIKTGPQRSISDLSILTAKSTDSESGESQPGSTRVKVKLPRLQVERIMKESGDQVEIAHRILQLYLGDSPAGNGGDAVEMTTATETGVVGGGHGTHRFDVRRPTCLPYGSFRRKYKRLTA